MELTLDLKQDILKKTEKEALAEALSLYGEDGKGSLYYPNLNFTANGNFEYNSDNDELDMGGDITTLNGENLGYLNLSVKMDFDTIIDIIQAYMKKLGKLKTILEATK